MAKAEVTTIEVSGNDRYTRPITDLVQIPSYLRIADDLTASTLFEVHAINNAREDIWPSNLQSLLSAQNSRYKLMYPETASDLADPSTRDFSESPSEWEWVPYLLRRLNEMAVMTTEYRPTNEILNRAWNTACRYFSFSTATPSIVLGDEGSVLFVWHKNGWDVELEIGQSCSYVGILSRDNKQMLFGPLEDMSGKLLGVLKSMSDIN